MKVLVTGANGYIGRYVVKSLLDKGTEVIACDIRTDNVDNRAIKKSLNPKQYSILIFFIFLH